MTIEYKDSKRIISSPAEYKIHTFNADSTFTLSSGSGNINYVIIGGGAGGGGASYNSDAGGGGAGQYKTGTLAISSARGYTIDVGAGGAGGIASTNNAGNNGSNGSYSRFDDGGAEQIQSDGGGLGAGVSGQNGNSGGSGGGGAGQSASVGGTGGAANGTGTNAGGDANVRDGGGGGGAGGAGADGVDGTGVGHGGIGVVNPLSGSTSGVLSGSSYYFAAGGGAGRANGGTGGGGVGSQGSGALPVSGAGVANTGSGGGGAHENNDAGGAGGTGVIIISYVDDGSITATGGTITIGGSAPQSKPTDVPDNSILIEKDTAKRYWASVIGNTGLKAYYKFDNASGNLVNQAATVGSSSSNGVDMINTNVTLNQTGLIGKSYLYSATDTSNDGSASTNWEFTYGSGAAFTFVGWYKQTGASEIEQCPLFDTSDSGNGLGSLVKVNGSNGNRQVSCKFHNGSASEVLSTATGTFPSDTNWHFIAMRATLNGGAVKFTIDGSTTTTTSSINGADGTANSRMGIGNIYRSTSIACRGNLDELSFWDRILTDAEVTALYNSGSGQAVGVATWTMNPTWEDNFADFTVDTTVDNTEVKGWTPNDASEAWIDAGTNSLDFNQGNDSSNNAIVFDMQSSYGTGANISDTKWRLDFETIYDSFSGGQNQALHWFGFSSDDETVSRGTAQDGITIQFNPYASNWGISDADNTALPEDGTGMSLTYSTATTYYWSIWRDGDTVTATRWSDSTRSTASQTDTEDISAKTITGLRYIKWMNRTLTSIGTVVGRITNITMYNGAISPN